MNILDYLMLIPAIWFGYKGLKNGLIAELTSILGLFIGLWAISKIIPTLNLWFGDNKMTKFIAIIILFILVIVIVYFLGKIVEKIVSLVIPKLFNYLFGLLFGILKVVLAFTMIFYFINAIDHKGFLFK